MKVLKVLGIGPGRTDQLTEAVRRELVQAQVIAGYGLYVDLVRELNPGALLITNGMRREEERCRAALQSAMEGKRTVMLSSGDAGVYGMASLLLELAPEYEDVEIAVYPGVTAALSGAALLGAPLGHDFCVISLSDLLTPWELIERRLKAAAKGDFVICLYNPGSSRRRDALRKACGILLSDKDPDTVCALARNIGRDEEEVRFLGLKELGDVEADMLTTVFIGSSATKMIGGRMVTPRGYRHENPGIKEG